MNTQTRYIDTAEVAKLVRASLKGSFPTVKFAVRSHRYAGGSSINVRWLDGPKTAEVEAVAKQFQGASFDGMIDLKSYHNSELDGETVHFGADYVFCDREISPERKSEIITAIEQATGQAVSHSSHFTECVKIENRWYCPDNYGSYLSELVWRVFNEAGDEVVECV